MQDVVMLQHDQHAAVHTLLQSPGGLNSPKVQQGNVKHCEVEARHTCGFLIVAGEK